MIYIVIDKLNDLYRDRRSWPYRPALVPIITIWLNSSQFHLACLPIEKDTGHRFEGAGSQIWAWGCSGSPDKAAHSATSPRRRRGHNELTRAAWPHEGSGLRIGERWSQTLVIQMYIILILYTKYPVLYIQGEQDNVVARGFGSWQKGTHSPTSAVYKCLNAIIYLQQSWPCWCSCSLPTCSVDCQHSDVSTAGSAWGTESDRCLRTWRYEGRGEREREREIWWKRGLWLEWQREREMTRWEERETFRYNI